MRNSIVHRLFGMAAVASAFTLTYAAGAANIGYVGGLTGGALDKPFDIGWSARLTSQGHTVTVIDQNTSSNSPVFAGLNLLIVSQDVGAATVRNNIGLGLDMPYLAYEPGLYSDFFGAGNGSRAGVSGGVTIVNSTHALAAGLSGNVSVYTGSENTSAFDVSEVSSGTTLIAQMVSTPNNGVLAVLEAGAIGGSGRTWSHLRMAVPAHDSWNPALVTTDGWKLLDVAVAYAVPEPGSFALLGLGMAFILARRPRG